MHKHLRFILCLVSTLMLSACDDANSPSPDTEIVVKTTPLSQNNIADLTADIAALQSLQALRAIDDEKTQATANQLNHPETSKRLFDQKRQSIQHYEHELNELDLKSVEAHRFRTQLKSFNQLTLEYQKVEQQNNLDQSSQKSLQQKLKEAQSELENTYRAMEKSISAAGA